MSTIGHALVSALWMAFAMGWEILWPLILGFTLSGVVQAVVTKAEMSRCCRIRCRDGVPVRLDQSGERTPSCVGSLDGARSTIALLGDGATTVAVDVTAWKSGRASPPTTYPWLLSLPSQIESA